MCTAIKFNDSEDNLYFGRNLDWSCGYSQKVVITPIGYKPNSPFRAIKEIQYPVIGMGIIEEDTPLYFDCANNQGLAIAGLNFPGYAEYLPGNFLDESILKIAAFEFPLWVTANHKTVEEVKRGLVNAAILDRPINEKYPSSLLHWIISDNNNCIVVEQTKNGLEIFDNPFGVLANQPGFDYHRENLKNYLNLSAEVPSPIGELSAYGPGCGMRGLPGDYYSTSRFVRAEYLNRNYPIKETEKENVNKMFHLLQGVSMIDGAAKMINRDFEKTIYSSCYSCKTNTYYFMDYDDFTIKKVELDENIIHEEELIV